MTQISAPVSTRDQVLRFLLLGGFAAAVNWLIRFPLSLVLPLDMAVFVAYLIGMSVGFTLYRRYVFAGAQGPVVQQIAIFLGVNLVGAIVVVTLTLGLVHIEQGLSIPLFAKQGLAHGLAIGFGAVVNFLGHKTLTFRPARTSRNL